MDPASWIRSDPKRENESRFMQFLMGNANGALVAVASVASMPAPSLHSRTDLIEIGDGRRLRLVDVVGKGASSVVHRAVMEQRNGLHRLVAVKLFGSVASEEMDSVIAVASRTATRAACVRHPNIVETYDFGEFRTQPYFVTELVEGVNLQALLDRYAEKSLRLPLDLALFIACEVAEALSGARTARDHRRMQVGMLHLSLGPRKVLLGWRGEVKVNDFETSMAAAASSSIRSLRAVTHRTATMAPEVAQGQIAGDSRSDVFSLGVILRELFVGPRFGREVKNADAVRLAREGFVQPMSFQPHLPPVLVQVMARALQIDPNHRYPNASAMAFELRRIALAMGVGDGRLFLRRTLDREFGNDASEVTAEHMYSSAPPAAAASAVELDDLHDLDGLPTIADPGIAANMVSESDILDDE
jgi:serine/threonine protein kinase